jgi:hypothetical protein
VIQHKILSKKNYAFIEVRGRPTIEEFLAAASLFINDPNYGAEVHRIADFSQANLEHITVENLVNFVEYASTQIPMHCDARCAIVAPDSARAGIFQSFAGQIEAGTFQVFTDPRAAVEWIREAPKVGVHFDKILSGVA